ncbi:hypothetical protein B484DRAFT_398014 [Ochromonadaceae sp. CCMP2298]|nr:hypothetical protein B484DRAFT_398014 [Ochromonadaceae sp. CCMP2298]
MFFSKRKGDSRAKRSLYSFHRNPEKSWHYYESMGQGELESLVLKKDRGDKDKDKDRGGVSPAALALRYEALTELTEDSSPEFVHITAEGITRLPFKSEENDFRISSRLSSYFSFNAPVTMATPASAMAKAPISLKPLQLPTSIWKTRSQPFLDLLSFNNDTPHNSPTYGGRRERGADGAEPEERAEGVEEGAEKEETAC